MTSSRPYLIRAIFDWLVDNEMTPYLMVDAMDEKVRVPEQYVEDGKIVLNIQPKAVANLCMGNEVIEFDARFSGISHHILVSIESVKAIYAFENGRGMVFGDEDDDVPPTGGGAPEISDSKPSEKEKSKKTTTSARPSLKIVK